VNDPHPEIVIVRRHSAEEDAHHGGAWKIAFADFMTAMMAFFLVLWIISATDKNTKTIIARYFNPVKIEEPAKAQKGIKGAPEQNSDTPGDDSKAPKAEKPRPDPVQSPNSANEPAPASGAIEAQTKHPKPDSPIPPDPVKPNPTMSEEELFADPRASLDKIAGAPPPGPRVDLSATLKGYGDVGPSMDAALRDPFDPLGSDKAIETTPPEPGAPLPPSSSAQGEKPPNREALVDRPAASEAASPAPASPTPQQTQPGPRPQTAEAKPPAAPQAAEARAQEAARLLEDVQKRLTAEGQAAAGPHLEIQASDEGVLISLTDRQNFSMFPVGSAEPQPHVVRMMDAIAMSIAALPGEIVVRGHTDGRPYRSKTYDNWRLSSARAQIAYYMLLRGGVPEKRFDRIEGFADHKLKDPAHPLAPENRRIEILLQEPKR
jgi:chemotaxis protein MotB